MSEKPVHREAGDIVLSSRIRLARNVCGIPFPTTMNDAQGIEIAHKVVQAMQDDSQAGDYRYIQMRGMDDLTKLVLVEKHLASWELIKNTESGALLVKDDETSAIMINEEDHLRIQSLLPAMDLSRAAQAAYEVEEHIARSIPFAFDDTLGYLCTCPTNVGTGLRASVMMHLPAVKLTGQIKPLLDSVMRAGLAVRGTFGEGSQPLGDLYQISNRTTLGSSEEEFISVVEQVCRHLADKEREAREQLLEYHRLETEDRLLRSWGVMNYARRIKEKEFMYMLSDVRLGVVMGIINDIDLDRVDQIMLAGQPAMVQKLSGRLLETEQREVQRARIIQKIIQTNNQ